MTDDQFTAWLNDSTALPVVLLEVQVLVSGTETTRYLSNAGYTTGAADTPANRSYEAIITGGVKITESVSLSGNAYMAAGEVDIYNEDGSRDSWLGDIWTNRPLIAWIGDVRWPRADFRKIFSGVVADIAPNGRSRLTLKLRDKLQQLNTPISDVKLGGECSYTQSGTTVTVTKPSHGRRVSSTVEVQVNSGTAASGAYSITGVTTDTFTYTSSALATTSGSLTIVGVGADSLVPACFGEVHNIVPLLTDPATLEYQCHGGTVESMFEVRDNGVPVTVTAHASTGKFELAASPAGTVTVSAQGDKPDGTYRNTIASIIKRLVTGYGKASQRFTTADIDEANFFVFDSAHPQPVGIYLSDRTNVLVACQQLAASVGAQLVMSRTGLLRLVQITLPATGTATPITRDQQLEKSLTPVAMSEVAAAVKIAYCRNYSVQVGLQTNISARDKALFAQEWLTVTEVDSQVQSDRRLDLEPEQEETCLQVGSDARAEARRRLAIRKVTRITYRFEGTPDLLNLSLGQVVRLYSHRFGLDAGAVGVVTSLTPNWKNRHITVEVMI